MKINEVEAQVGITKKNIRFYEEQGLLSPRRNSQNGYRDYGPGEVEVLRQIKLLRKLGVPLEEIRRMQSGKITVGDGMRRHLVTLDRERHSLDAAALLKRMEELEQAGATFQDKQRGDFRPFRYVAPAVITVLTVALMLGLIGLMIWGFTIDVEDAPPLPLVVVLVMIPGVVILGVVLALVQRLQEIGKGEEEDAKRF